jgi:hypothetical protein
MKCNRINCLNLASKESYLPGGWVPECDIHAEETYLNNWQADCFKQCEIGNHNEMFHW